MGSGLTEEEGALRPRGVEGVHDVGSSEMGVSELRETISTGGPLVIPRTVVLDEGGCQQSALHAQGVHARK